MGKRRFVELHWANLHREPDIQVFETQARAAEYAEKMKRRRTPDGKPELRKVLLRTAEEIGCYDPPTELPSPTLSLSCDLLPDTAEQKRNTEAAITTALAAIGGGS